MHKLNTSKMENSQRVRLTLEEKLDRLSKLLDKIMIILAGAALATLVIEYGFFINQPTKSIIHLIDISILSFFIFHHFAKLIISKHPLKYLRSHWIEFLLSTLILLQFIGLTVYASFIEQVNISAITRFYIVATQVYIILDIGIKTIRYSREIAQRSIHPTRILVTSFIILILLGTFLLLLPKSTYKGISLIDALFTATSAVCVTGLTVVDTATYFTRFGQWIILILFQLGGLGIMTFTTFFAILLGGGMGIRERIVLSEIVNETNFSKISSTIASIVLLTFTIEAIGVLILFNLWDENLFQNVEERFFFSLFHSVSAFCNAGFSTFSENLNAVRNNPGIILTISLLFLSGGLGFIVMFDILTKTIFASLRKINFFRDKIPFEKTQYSLHTKLTLTVTAILIISGTISFFIFEYNGVLRDEGLFEKLIHAFFQSTTPRTAGFNTVNIGNLSMGTSLLLMFLMWIGASPGSTGGGIKTTSIGVMALKIYSLATGRDKVEVFNRQISESTVTRAFATATLSIIFIMSATFLLTLTENKSSLVDILFESISAFSTVGLSRGLTQNLTNYGKLIIIMMMFIGRVGPLAFIFAVAKQQEPARYEFPKENVLVT
jgi:potassium uptake TrkH family protein